MKNAKKKIIISRLENAGKEVTEELAFKIDEMLNIGISGQYIYESIKRGG